MQGISSTLQLFMFGLVHQFSGLTRTCPKPDQNKVPENALPIIKLM